MTTDEIREKFLEFYKKRNHAIIPPAPIVPTDDSTTLFTTSGMQQLVPYLKGELHPMGKRLVNSQPCLRAEDIEEVGDNRHTTFFEMLGNWSLGDYFKEDQLTWFWEFLTNELKLPKSKLHVTLFEGDSNIPKDEESLKIWKNLGVKDDHIYYYGVDKNWWSRAGTPDQMPVGEIGGPTCEIFFEYKQVQHDNKYGQQCHPNCNCGRFLEIGNSVFMEYEKTKEGLKSLPAKNVDFGGGLERLAMITQGETDIFETDIFKPIISAIERVTDNKYQGNNKVPTRIIADHLRAATFIASQGLTPSNKEHGYVLRKLIRRAITKMHYVGFGNSLKDSISEIIGVTVNTHKELGNTPLEEIDKIIIEESLKFAGTLDRGIKEIHKYLAGLDTGGNFIPATEKAIANKAFDLYQSQGVPAEVFYDEFKSKFGFILAMGKFDFHHFIDTFEKKRKTHSKKSRTASAGMFKGGLADQSDEVTKLHTATHLLHQALRQVLGDHITQQGSNITASRLRFDFSHNSKLTSEEIKKTEELINKKISENLPITKSILDKEEALSSGAIAFFREKYPDKVSVYTIGKDPEKNWFSKELCGGPHVSSTSDIGGVTIKKEESLGAGKRRIYAVLK